MLQRFISVFWLLTFAMALPMQASAYLLQAESEASSRLNRQFNPSITYTDSDFQTLFEQVKQQSKPEPVTKADMVPDWLAIINASRLLGSTRYLDDGESSSGLELTDGDATSASLFKLYKLPFSEASFTLKSGYASPYRVSGWKDSNTLYVALNGQFSLIS